MRAPRKRTETPGQALQQACREHAHRAMALLAKPVRPQTAHRVRKEIKKLRARFRLLRGGMSGKHYRETAQLLRLAAKPLAPAREAQVALQAFTTLAGKEARRFPTIHFALATRSSQARRSLKEHDLIALARLLLKHADDRLGALKSPPCGAKQIQRQLKKSHERSQKAWRLALRKATPDQLHEWRKCVKRWRYQLAFLGPDRPQTQALLRDLDQLCKQLGQHRDLALLGQFAKTHCPADTETRELCGRIVSEQKQLAAGIRQLGLRLFTEPAEAVGTPR